MTQDLRAPQRKKLHTAWAMYDWGNSAYNLVITSTIFPVYYNAVTTTKSADGKSIFSDEVVLFGHSFHNTALSNYTLAVAYAIVVILSPILSSVADLRGNKKRFMQLFTYLGGLACCGLFFFDASSIGWGLACFALAAIGYCGGLVFYNAYLPEIATDAEQDKVSAKGFALGYIGSVLLQIVCFTFFFFPQWYGMEKGSDALAAKISFLLVGLWWMGFAQIPFLKLPKGTPRIKDSSRSILNNAAHELKKVFIQVKSMPVLRTYLGAFFLYSMGVQTVMLAAANFGAKELHLESSQLIITILVIQLVAIAGAYLMAKLSEKFGNLRVLLLVVGVWIGICVAAYFTYTAVQFYILAGVVGLVMGGIQSLSRSTYAKLMPETRDTASFFSFYDVTEKLAIVIGIFTFGFIEETTGSMRNSILVLIVFFVAGASMLFAARRRQVFISIKP
ncbi:MAG: MFS transporter [Chitinophagaceae bacterium]